MVVKMKVISLLILALATHLAYSRSITNLRSDGVDSSPEWRISAATQTCAPVYGFLPCSSNVWGHLFLIVVYQILLSFGGQYVARGSNLLFQIIGPGGIGGSLFQLLNTIPQIVLVLVSALSGDAAAAQERVAVGMGLVVGTTIMLLTLTWGLSVVFGSYDPSENTTTDDSESRKTGLKGSGVVTDVETSYTARIILITLVPFLFLQLKNVFSSRTLQRVVILLALIITAALLVSYILYQSFRPWIQNRCFEFMVNKYAKDKLLKLISRNGKSDTGKIQQLFNQINKNNDASISAAELRVLLLGLKMDDNDEKSTEREIERTMNFFDTSGDGRINQDEFIKGMTKLASDLSNQTPAQTAKSVGSNSQNTSQDQQALLASSTSTSTSTSQTTSNTWSIIFQAAFFLIVGTFMVYALGQPLMASVTGFTQAVNMSPFYVSYVVIPLAVNYGVAIQSITSARQKTQKSISLTLSALYGSVYMNNIMGLMSFLAPVYVRNLSTDVSAEVLVNLLLCIIMTIFTSLNTTFPRWIGYLALLLYPICLATVFLLTSVFGWP